MKKTYKKEIANKYYAIRYWNALVNNDAVKSATMGKTLTAHGSSSGGTTS